MKIGIDARSILSPEKGEAIGVGHYTYQLIRNLLEIDKNNQYVLFFDWRAREKDIKKFSKPNVKIKYFPFSDYAKYLPGAYNEILVTATLAKEELDILHATSSLSRVPIGYRGKLLVTFHDLGVFKVPETYPKIKKERIKTVISMMAKKADKIITVSESLTKDLEEILKIKPEKMEVIYSGLDKRFFERSNISQEKICQKYDLGEKYILFLGTLEPSKNITRLLEAFSIFSKSDKGKGYKLVLAGKKGWLSSEYAQIAQDFNLSKKVIFPGYIIGDELVPLFEGAQFFVMPSLYEGFGTTVLEALATGTPAIVSHVSSIPEIAGESVRYVNPMDTKEIAGAMIDFSKTSNLRDNFSQKAKERAHQFDWGKCARETLEVYNKLFQK